MGKIKTIERYSHTTHDKLYFPAIFKGLKITFSRFYKNLKDVRKLDSLEYPEEQPTDITERYRGLHRLTKREDESIKCVACFMCATACPADCIFIEAQDREDGVDEKEPSRFAIDTLECIFCGYCVEACPCDAIRMDTGIFSVIAKAREDFVLEKETLLSYKGKFEKEDSIG